MEGGQAYYPVFVGLVCQWFPGVQILWFFSTHVGLACQLPVLQVGTRCELMQNWLRLPSASGIGISETLGQLAYDFELKALEMKYAIPTTVSVLGSGT